MNIPNDGVLNCASDGIYIDIGGTNSLRNRSLNLLFVRNVRITQFGFMLASFLSDFSDIFPQEAFEWVVAKE